MDKLNPTFAKAAKLVSLITIASTVIFVIMLGPGNLQHLKLNELKVMNLGVLFSGFLLMALIVERAVEVILNACFAGNINGHATTKTPNETLPESGSLANKEIGEPPQLSDLLHRKVCKTRTAFLISLSVGLLISVSGFQMIQSASTAFGGGITALGQAAFVTIGDILISAVLISGGADTIHGIINPFLKSISKSNLASIVKTNP